MADIREFSAPDLSLRPNEAGTEAAAQAGRRIGAFYHQMGQDLGGAVQQLGDAYEEHQTQQEISHGYATGEAVHTGLSQQLQDAANKADPNDPTWAQSFLADKVDPAVQQWQDSFKTKKGQLYAAEHAASMREQLTRQAISYRSELAGRAAVDNINTAANQGMARVFTDPAQLDDALSVSDYGIKATLDAHPGLAPEQSAAAKTELSAKVRRGLVISAVQGRSNAGDFDGARTLINGGKYNDEIGNDKEALLRSVDTAERIKQEGNKAAEVEQRRKEDEVLGQASNQIRLKMTRPDGTLAPDAQGFKDLQALASLPGAGRHYAEISAMGNAMQEAVKRQIDHSDVQSDPGTFNKLLTRVGLPATSGGLTHTDINVAYANGRLSDHDYTKLGEMVEKNASDPATKEMTKTLQEFYTSVKTSFGASDPLTGQFVKPEAAQRFYQFQTDTQRAIDSAIATGQKPGDVVKTLLNPRDQTFLGNRVGKYTITSQQGMQVLSADAAAAAGKGGAKPVFAPPSLGQVEGANAPPDAAAQAKAFKSLTPDQQAWLNARRAQKAK